MVDRSVVKKDEIRAYIKARSKLGCSLKKLMTEISTAFGPSCVSYDTVRRWKKKFESGVESIKNAPKSGRPKSASPPPPPSIPQTLPHVISFYFRNWKHSLLGGNTSPDRHLDPPFISTLLLCPDQRTMTPSRSGYIGWNFAFLATGSTSRAWNEYFWANLKFEVSR